MIEFEWQGDNIYNKLNFTNEGETNASAHLLPPAYVGLEYNFEVKAAFNFEIEADGSDLIRVGETLSSPGGKVRSSTIGSYIKLKVFEAGKWTATELIGVWEVL